MAACFDAGAQQTGMRDPTRPYSFQQSDDQRPLRLEAIFMGAGREKGNVAVINGQTLSVGDKIRSFKLTRISQGQVILEQNGAQQTLTLEEPVADIKREVHE
jgi:type II secretory pathway component PulC